MIYVTHDQVEAMTLGQRIVVLKDGEIQQIDTPMALYERPANLFVAAFLGSPAMNVLRGRAGRRRDGLVAATLGDGVASPLGEAPRSPAAWLGSASSSIGMRPETPAAGAAGRRRLRATVEVVEPVGNEVFVNLRCGPHAAGLAGAAARPAGDRRQCHRSTIADRLHWLRPASGHG